MIRQALGVGVCCGLLAAALAHGWAAGPTGEHRVELRPRGGELQHGLFTFDPATGRLGGIRSARAELVVVVDGARLPLRVEPDSFAFELELEPGRVVRAVLRLRAEGDVLHVALETAGLGAHSVALGLDVDPEAHPIFLAGHGEIADSVEASGRFLVVENTSAPLGVTSLAGAMTVVVRGHEHGPPTDLHLQITAPSLELTATTRTATAWETLHRLAGLATGRVTGVVRGSRQGARVVGLDAQGVPQLRMDVGADGRFELAAPRTVTAWYAALDASRTSAPVPFEPGTPFELRLDVAAGGELAARVVDGESGQPLTARLVVHGIDGTLDPSFGPDYRASGAGPIVDALRGTFTTPLPAGRYRVAATRGIEWSVDARLVEISPGRTSSVVLAPRHVVPTPAAVGCDLHVHARPSFDTPVSTEDRVLSLVAAGVDFAVPTEHNVVGDYRPGLDELELGGELSFVPGVEVTTYSPSLGHFGVFPFPPGKVPPYRHTSLAAVLRVARRGDPARIVQIHHPRLPQKIGYFELNHFDPSSGKIPPQMRTDFDAIEVYNGYEIGSPERIEAVLRDYQALLSLGYRYVATGSSDSHRIQYQWAGYPRTLVALPPGTSDAPGTLDVTRVIAELKRGHATVTTGPVIELEVRGTNGQRARPGDDLTTEGQEITAHVVVRAAPWVDVSEVEVLLGGKLIRHLGVLSRPTQLGPELGTREEAAARTVRVEQDIVVPLSTAPRTWLMVLARGSRQLDDVLPFMPVLPMAFTNPVWVQRPGVPPLPYAGAGSAP